MTRIARIEAWAFRCPTPKPVATSFGIMQDRPAVLVRIEDDEGAFGWGEIFANWPAAGAEHRLRLLEMDIAPLVLGQDATDPAALFHRLEAATRVRAMQCGEIGPFAQVLAGLDIAAWDMAARRAKQPLRRMINPDAPAEIPAYASGIQISNAADIVPQADAAGHERFKLKVGFDLDSDIRTVTEIQKSLPLHRVIACDANQAWSLDQALRFVAGVGDLPLAWIEEPLPVFAPNWEWTRLATKANIPLAGGENMIGMAQFDTAITGGPLSVIQPDIAKWGGITGCLAVAQKAMAAGQRYCPHFLGAGLGLIASAELLAGVGGDGWLEVDVNENPLRTGFFPGLEPVYGGIWYLGDDDGLGIEALPEPILPYQTAQMERAE